MASADSSLVRPLLLERRGRLERAVAAAPDRAEVDRLIGEVDEALSRLDAGSYGRCETCHDPIEPERLLADPLLRFCIDHLDAEEQRALQADLESAGRLQRRLLPPPRLNRSRWEVAYHLRPAGPVSGDFCDFFPLEESDDGLFVLLGDVAGKGVAAGLVTAHLHASFHSFIPGERSVACLVERVNHLFRASALAPHFATLIAARLESDGGVELCNAAHCPPLLATANAVTMLAPTGMPVGAFYSSAFTAHRFAMEPGATLLLYTDGVTEARDREGREFGVEPLHTMLATRSGPGVDALLEGCLGELERHIAGGPIADDITLVVVRRTA